MGTYECVFTETAVLSPRQAEDPGPGGAGVYEAVFHEIEELLPSAPPSVLTVTPDTFTNEGGEVVTVTLQDAIDGVYNIYLGPLGSTLDPVMYSGVSGDGNDITIENGVFSAVIPFGLAIGGSFFFTIVPTGVGITEVIDSLISIVAHQLRSGVFNLRRNLSPRMQAGPRKSEFEGFPQE